MKNSKCLNKYDKIREILSRFLHNISDKNRNKNGQ